MFVQFMPAGLLGQSCTSDSQDFNPRLPPTFSFNRRSFSEGDPCSPEPRHLFDVATAGDRSTGSKQTLNGLFLCTPQIP